MVCWQYVKKVRIQLRKRSFYEFRQTDLPEADIVSGAHCLTVKHMDEEPVNNLKKGKAAMTYNRLNK